VNKSEIVNIAGDFEAEALRILRDIPGITVDAQPRLGNHRPDAILRFADRQATVAVEIKQRANAATAWQLVHYAELYPDTPMLLIAGETTADARQILQERGIAFVDGLQNAHIELPGLMFHIDGHGQQRRATGYAPPTKLWGKAGVAAQALMMQPDREWTVRELAQEGGIAPALAHRVLTRLEREGVITSEGSGPRRVRRVTNPAALLDLWAEEQADRPTRTPGYLLAQTPRQLLDRIGASLGQADVDYALTGAAGASLVAPFVTAIPVADVWVSATAAPDDLHAAVGTNPVTEGHNVVFLQAKDDTPLVFRQPVHELWVANHFRLYADLRRDPRRGQEQANHLREEVIKF
jgi:hypothetical protein